MIQVIASFTHESGVFGKYLRKVALEKNSSAFFIGKASEFRVKRVGIANVRNRKLMRTLYIFACDIKRRDRVDCRFFREDEEARFLRTVYRAYSFFHVDQAAVNCFALPICDTRSFDARGRM